MSIRLNPFTRCACGRIHCRAGIGPNSACACGESLWPRLFAAPSPGPEKGAGHE